MTSQPLVGRRPQSPGELFRVFNRLALQGFGGVLPIAHRELVEREQWLSAQQFVELLALGQVLPGPNIINMSIIFGDRHFGWRGALAATAGLLTVPLAIVLLLALLYQQFASQALVTSALRGMGVVAAGLVIATAVKLLATLEKNPLGKPLCYAFGAATLVMVGLLRWPMVGVVLGLGAVAMGLAWRRLAKADKAAADSRGNGHGDPHGDGRS
ncbi:chromate transporter [Aquabacterium sp.]|uniref:chromate transporter n=1 Tax=Aquabacterium sp. TaxID=1872578 RepID=UPI002CDCD381|nr:chromate transporter [Aquabacterium sp.]HSW05853.1 chromate transporter [Aquabacterium sp.]